MGTQITSFKWAQESDPMHNRARQIARSALAHVDEFRIFGCLESSERTFLVRNP